MTSFWPRRTALFLLLLAALTGACRSRPQPVAHAYLFEKGAYQAVYDPAGRLLRLLYDGNGDKRADVVTLYGSNGLPQRAEIDSDSDNAIDRWELFGPDGTLLRVGTARGRPGQPDLWEDVDARGRVVGRALDANADGRPERRETFDVGGLVGVDLDTDGDGRVDRWQQWRAGLMTREDLDTDGDGEPDRRLRYDAHGNLLGLERLERLGGKGGAPPSGVNAQR